MKRNHTIAAIPVRLDEREVVPHANHWPPVTRQMDDGESAKHTVDRATLETELPQVGPRQKRIRSAEPI